MTHRLPLGRLGLFAAVGVLCLGYVLFSVVGAKTFEGSYRVVVDMPVTGGLFPGSQVTYRGVPIGTVSSIDITTSGVAANLDIHDSVHIPVATKAVVADRSPAGEQYLDMEPTAPGPPYLRDGSVIPARETVRPPSLADLLRSITAFSDSVDLGQLRTVFRELNTALDGTGPALAALIDHSGALVSELSQITPQTIDLLRSAGTLLDTQIAHDGDLRSFATSLRRLSDTIRADDPRTARLIEAALRTTQQLAPVLLHDSHDVGVLLTNLVTTGRIAVERLPGLKALVLALPDGLHALAASVHGGRVYFKLIDQPGTFCGYGGTRRRAPFNPHRGPPITNGYCKHPLPIQQQRGAANEPRPPGDDTAGPPSPHSNDYSWQGVYTAGEQ
ncbi:MAG TPA: MlaD family protein [Mycobacteriales bacterium]|nr:MlaD family protein [Mycobacteriales bacterium]